jgi:hypothetical protein
MMPMKKSLPPPRLIPEGHPLDLLGRVKDLPLQGATVLNLGAGICGSPISEQLHFFPCQRLINVEKFGPYMEQLKTMPFAAKNVEFHQLDIREYVDSPLMPQPDISLLIDVLEHLPREDALHVLNVLKQRTKRRLLIWLPLGECPIEPFHNNPYQVHLSTWFENDEAFAGHRVEKFERYHEHLDPPADAGWVIIDTTKPDAMHRALGWLRGETPRG